MKTREDLQKMTMKELKAYYEEVAGYPYTGRSIRKKEEFVGVIRLKIYDIIGLEPLETMYKASERVSSFSLLNLDSRKILLYPLLGIINKKRGGI